MAYYINYYKETIETWDKVAQQYQDKFMNMNLYDDTYDLFCNLIQKQNAEIFEIGCGPGNITQYILSKRPDLKIEAIDVAPRMIELAEINNPTADFKVMDCRQISTITKKFDALICGFCLPYLSGIDCEKLIKDCTFLLHKGGLLYLSTIEGAREKSGYEQSSDKKNKMYIYYYEEDYISKQLKSNNLEVVKITRRSYPANDGTTSCHLIYIARKSK